MSRLHLDFIFSPLEIAQAVEYIDATVDALLGREFKFPANINTESTFQGEILDPQRLSDGLLRNDGLDGGLPGAAA